MFEGVSSRQDNDLIAEMAFGLFCAAAAANTEVGQLNQLSREQIVRMACDRIALLRGPACGGQVHATTAHQQDAFHLALRLQTYFAGTVQDLQIQPRIEGLGVLGSCYADLARGGELIEVKMRSTGFMSIDVRQILIYAALANSRAGRSFGTCTLVNPRLGASLRFNVCDLIRQISELSPEAFYRTFQDFLLCSAADE
jgi:hypothetical protein